MKLSNNRSQSSRPGSSEVDGLSQHAGKRSTISDVACFAGVSEATVSNYITGKGRMGRATRERVRVAMEVLHFVPNAHTRALREGRTKIIGVLPDSNWTAENPATALLYCSWFQGINEAADEAGYDLLLFTGDPSRHSVGDFLGGQIDGLLYGMCLEESDLPRRLSAAGLPAICALAEEPEGAVAARSHYYPSIYREAGNSAVKCLLALIRGSEVMQ